MMSTLSQTCVVGRAEVEQQRALRHFGGHRVARRVPACTITMVRSPPNNSSPNNTKRQSPSTRAPTKFKGHEIMIVLTAQPGVRDQRGLRDLGSGRIVASEIVAPNMLAHLV